MKINHREHGEHRDSLFSLCVLCELCGFYLARFSKSGDCPGVSQRRRIITGSRFNVKWNTDNTDDTDTHGYGIRVNPSNPCHPCSKSLRQAFNTTTFNGSLLESYEVLIKDNKVASYRKDYPGAQTGFTGMRCCSTSEH